MLENKADKLLKALKFKKSYKLKYVQIENKKDREDIYDNLPVIKY